MTGNVQRRLEVLEARARQRPSAGPSDARWRMVEHLGRVAAWRRGELGPDEAAEVEAESAAMRERLASRRREGGQRWGA